MKKNIVLYFIGILIFSIQSCQEDKDVLYPNKKIEIGQNYNGGTIFYIDDTGTHGLIADDSYQTTNIWGSTSISTASKDITIGSGQSNTTKIVSVQSCYYASNAACYCNDYIKDGYDDWYLPSLKEIELIGKNTEILNDSYSYWTSSEYSTGSAYYYNTQNITNKYTSKSTNFRVIPIRSF